MKGREMADVLLLNCTYKRMDDIWVKVADCEATRTCPPLPNSLTVDNQSKISGKGVPDLENDKIFRNTLSDAFGDPRLTFTEGDTIVLVCQDSGGTGGFDAIGTYRNGSGYDRQFRIRYLIESV